VEEGREEPLDLVGEGETREEEYEKFLLVGEKFTETLKQ
jgi:hypothetical protein